MILEGIVTTLQEDGGPNIAPMGPVVDPEITRLVLKPYQTSSTYRNLRRHGEGVFHVVDDVELLARAAINQLEVAPPTMPATVVQGHILTQACRWYAFRVQRLDDSQPRTWIECEIVGQGRLKDFFGLNRAKHAVVEAAILATRVGLLPAEQIQDDLQRLRPLVEKTGGEAEHRAFQLLEQSIREQLEAAGDK